MTPLTEDEKKEIAQTFLALHEAIRTNSPTVDETFKVFQQAYRGDSRAYVDSFQNVTDKTRWAGQLRLYLEDEIGHDGEYWIPGYERTSRED